MKLLKIETLVTLIGIQLLLMRLNQNKLINTLDNSGLILDINTINELRRLKNENK